MNSIITKHNKNCLFCGKPCHTEHHFVFGRGMRNLADEDGLKGPACDECHTIGKQINRIHDNPMAEKLSKMLGQLAFEKSKVAIGMTEEEAREAFRNRYGRSYL